MPYKIGGGFKLEAYDADNGQYTKEDKLKMIEFDNFWIKQPLTMLHEPHIPTFGIHNDEYAFKYIEKFKKYLYSENNQPTISESKSHFLLDGKIKPKRTKWLEDMGFRLPDKNNLECYTNKVYIHKFQKYIINHTDYNSLYFVRYLPDGNLSCNALTYINGHKITTGWKVTRDFQLQFVTLIETSKVYYETRNKIRW